MSHTKKSQAHPWQFSLRYLLAASVAIAIFAGGLVLSEVRLLFACLACGAFAFTLLDMMVTPWRVLLLWLVSIVYAAINFIAVSYTHPPWDALGFFALGGPILIGVASLAVHFTTPIKFRSFTWLGIVMFMGLSFIVNATLMAEWQASV